MPGEPRLGGGLHASLLAPSFILQALARSEPALAGRPLAVLGDGRTAQVSRAAAVLGVRPGMTPAQARSVCPGVVLRRVPGQVVSSASNALVDLALGWSPRVQRLAWGLVVLDLEGTSKLYPSLPALGGAMEAACRKAGFKVRVGMGPGPRLACVAARCGQGVTVLTRGKVASALAGQPVTVLAPSRPLLHALQGLGIRRVRDLARLDPARLGVRLGAQASDIHDLARGLDRAVLEPVAPSEVFEETVEPDYLLVQAEPLVFLLSSALDRLARRMRSRHAVPASARLELHLDPEGRHVVCAVPPAPTGDMRSFLGLFRLSLDSSPPPAPVRGFTLRATPGRVRPVQQGLFGPPGPEPTGLAALLGRLAAAAGPGNVGHPVTGHPSGTGFVAGFKAQRAKRRSSRTDPGHKGTAVGATPSPAIKRCRPPVLLRAGTALPHRIKVGGVTATVVRASGPWYEPPRWWAGRRSECATYDVETTRGVFRLKSFCGRWYVDGVYD